MARKNVRANGKYFVVVRANGKYFVARKIMRAKGKYFPLALKGH